MTAQLVTFTNGAIGAPVIQKFTGAPIARYVQGMAQPVVLKADAHAGSKSDIDASKELGYEALLKHTEALQLNSMEQDRGRLIPVAERLVKLGGDVGARDMEGRTALHLAAGCGDKNMVVRLVALGTHVNCKDSVGGRPQNKA